MTNRMEWALALALALVSVMGCSSSGPHGSAIERAQALCERTTRLACASGGVRCPETTDAVAASTGCDAELDAWLSCLETAEDPQFCSAPTNAGPMGPGICFGLTQSLGDCTNAHTIRCQMFGTCAHDGMVIEACADHGTNEYRVGTRTFVCSGSDCTAAQNELCAYCGC